MTYPGQNWVRAGRQGFLGAGGFATERQADSGCCDRAGTWAGRDPLNATGFTLVEVVIVVALFLMLMIGTFNALTLNYRATKRQAEIETALQAAQGKLESYRGRRYTYPGPDFSTNSYVLSSTVDIALDQYGSKIVTKAPMTTTVAPFKYGTNNVGHLVTTSITLTNGKPARTITLKTLVNEFTNSP